MLSKTSGNKFVENSMRRQGNLGVPLTLEKNFFT
jgi:hypothetical protein